MKKGRTLIQKTAGMPAVGATPQKQKVIERLNSSSGTNKHGRAGTGVNFSKKAQKM